MMYTVNTPGRNDPCPCGSGRKYKKCCLGGVKGAQERTSQKTAPRGHDLNTTNVNLPSKLLMQAVALQQAGRLDEAEVSYRILLKKDPNDYHALHYLGLIAFQKGHYSDAISLIENAIRLNPKIPAFHCNLGNAYRNLGQLDAAIAAYIAAIQLDPNFQAAHSNLGNTLRDNGNLAEAIESYRKALTLRPDFAEAHNNLGNALKDYGEMDQAIACFKRALSIKPNYTEAHSNLLFTLSFHEACTPAQYLDEARLYGRKVGALASPYTNWGVAPPGHDAHPLRVGLVSGDMRTHPVGFFLENTLKYLDRASVELIAYSTTRQEDELTERIKPCFAAWNIIAGLNDEGAARNIHADGIHILIDLAGHTAHNRLPVFAWKPAPVQISWLGYWASTGVPGMDFLLTDSISVPETLRGRFTETPWYLPETRLCLTPPTEPAAGFSSPLPAASKGYITFGSFQNLSKINDHVLALWGKIFQALPESRLRLQNTGMNFPDTRNHLLRRLSAAGIPPERVNMSGPVSRKEYLAAHAEVDIILDTFPYTGGTSTCEALWMGVPTLTLAGDSLIALQGASLLSCAGLRDWVANNDNEYVARALANSSDIDHLAKLRAGLRQQVLASPIFNAPRFARQLENALQDMWRQSTESTLNRETPLTKSKGSKGE